MSILSWIVLGLVAGYIGSLVVDRRGAGVVIDILIGIAGALLGGWVFQALGWGSVSGFNLASLLVAIVGSIILLLIYHAIRRATGTPPH